MTSTNITRIHPRIGKITRQTLVTVEIRILMEDRRTLVSVETQIITGDLRTSVSVETKTYMVLLQTILTVEHRHQTLTMAVETGILRDQVSIKETILERHSIIKAEVRAKRDMYLLIKGVNITRNISKDMAILLILILL